MQKDDFKENIELQDPANEDELFEGPRKTILLGEQYYEDRPVAFSEMKVLEKGVEIILDEPLEDTNCHIILYDRLNGGGETVSSEITPEKMTIFLDDQLWQSYESGVVRYTVMMIYDADEYVSTIQHSVKHVRTRYDKMSNLLGEKILGENALGEEIALLYYTANKRKKLRVAVQRDETKLKNLLEVKVKKVSLKKDLLTMNLELPDYGYRLSRVYMRLRSKTEDIEYDFAVNMQLHGHMWKGTAQIHLGDHELAQFYWDIKGRVEKDGREYPMALKNREKWMHRFMYLKWLQYRYPDGNIAYPYKTKSKDIAVQFRPATEHDTKGFVFKEYMAFLVFVLLRPFLKRKNIWLVYEKYCVMAQDNGFYFFKYCMEQLPEKEKKHIYYVIDKKSTDYQYVRQYEPHVLDFLSFKHMVYLLAARLLISSDTRAHAYAWHSPDSVYRNYLRRKKNVFLQHGVMMFKCCHQGLRKKSFNGSAQFVVSSDVEKKIIEDYFGYNEDQILVTGLARWDVLHDKSQEGVNEIILMPTWRTWLEEVSQEVFVESEYYKHYMQLLNDPVLLKTLEEHDVILNFYIHPKFREYIGNFSVANDRVRLIEFGTEPLNEMMMRCRMMITDYSSAVWDVFYQGKPVLFYLFDLEQYLEIQGSYIDMESETFGDVAYTPEQLSQLISEYAANGFKEKEQYAAMRPSLIKYIDNDNSKRTYEEIMKRYSPTEEDDETDEVDPEGTGFEDDQRQA